MRLSGQHIIDLSILGDNFEALRKLAPSNEVCFMVKANAYGHGLLPIVEFSYENANIKEFGLASLGEALQLRDAFPKMKSELYVFSDLGHLGNGAEEAYLNKRILPVISSLEELNFILDHPEFKYFPLILKFDTGMNRLGIKSDDETLDCLLKSLKRASRKSLYHVMSHLGCSSLSMSKNSKNINQLRNFDKVKSFLKDSGIDIERTSISNSGAIEQGAGLLETHIRPGLMLYGPSSLIDKYQHLSQWKQPNISRLETEVIKSSMMKKGTPIGYGATPIPRSGLIAIIAMGYGDGLSTHYQNSKINSEGYQGQIIGRINMDMAQVLFEEAAKLSVVKGSKVNIFGHDAGMFRAFCMQTKTIPYEIFLSISGRVPKNYLQ